MGMGRDRQHKEYRRVLLGLRVYFGNEDIDVGHWRSKLLATALVMRNHDPELAKKRVGASTAAVWLTRLALKWMPEPYATEIQREYVILEQKRQALADIDAANKPAP